MLSNIAPVGARVWLELARRNRERAKGLFLSPLPFKCITDNLLATFAQRRAPNDIYSLYILIYINTLNVKRLTFCLVATRAATMTAATTIKRQPLQQLQQLSLDRFGQ